MQIMDNMNVDWQNEENFELRRYTDMFKSADCCGYKYLLKVIHKGILKAGCILLM